MNTSLIPDYINQTVPFWYFYSAALTDGAYVAPVSPMCPGRECLSYFFPGGIREVFPSPPTIQGYDSADGFIVYDTPGFQIDFYPTTSAITWSVSDCKIYGPSHANGLGICMKQAGNDIIAGTSCVLILLIPGLNVCESSSNSTESCFTNTTWLEATNSTQVTINQRFATTVYGRTNYTILDFLEFTEPVSANYTVDEFFQFYDMAFDFDSNTPSSQTNFMFFEALNYDIVGQSSGFIDLTEAAAHLRRLIAIPVSVFNDRFLDPLGNDLPKDNMNRTAALAVGENRVNILHLWLTKVGHFIEIVRRIRCGCCVVVDLVDYSACPLHVRAIPKFVSFSGN